MMHQQERRLNGRKIKTTESRTRAKRLRTGSYEQRRGQYHARHPLSETRSGGRRRQISHARADQKDGQTGKSLIEVAHRRRNIGKMFRTQTKLMLQTAAFLSIAGRVNDRGDDFTAQELAACTHQKIVDAKFYRFMFAAQVDGRA